MNSDNTAIKVQNISKYYRIGLKEEMQGSFAGSVMSFIKSPLKNFKKYPDQTNRVFALTYFYGLKTDIKKEEIAKLILSSDGNRSNDEFVELSCH